MHSNLHRPVGVDRRSDGNQSVLMQMLRAMMEQNGAQHLSQQQMQKEMIEQNKEVTRQNLKPMALVVNKNSTGNQENRNISPLVSRSSIDQNERALKIRKAFSPHLVETLLPDKI